jgi:hypothetical protein
MYLFLIILTLLSPIVIVIIKILYPLYFIAKYKRKYGKLIINHYRPLAGMSITMRKYKETHLDSGALYKDL